MINRALRIVEARGVGLCASCGLETWGGAERCPNCQFELEELEALGRLDARNHYSIRPRAAVKDGLAEALFDHEADHQAWEDNDPEYAERARAPRRRMNWTNAAYLAGSIAVAWWMVWEFVNAAWKR